MQWRTQLTRPLPPPTQLRTQLLAQRTVLPTRQLITRRPLRLLTRPRTPQLTPPPTLTRNNLSLLSTKESPVNWPGFFTSNEHIRANCDQLNASSSSATLCTGRWHVKC